MKGGRCCGIATRRRVASGFDTLEAITPSENSSIVSWLLRRKGSREAGAA
jgi:hypothetical protein